MKAWYGQIPAFQNKATVTITNKACSTFTATITGQANLTSHGILPLR
jgi:hypothetical protein